MEKICNVTVKDYQPLNVVNNSGFRDLTHPGACICNSKQQVDEFFGIPSFGHNQEPLIWWQENKEHYPNLAPHVQHYLHIPPKSVTSGRLFSNARQIVTIRRKNIKPKLVEKIEFQHDNL
ncbi:hypothetical protein PR048_001352 [Dryococelus australis]|uniref:HAT C-terminal dimerisation domain-containing protein n=1 Tax=Dryococelus australis TaxID=614101 RepID=A0ABQ9IH84_9NEOP|nr:hypothetical protein PR048_001352 [Dryococelus australis]